MPSRRSSQRHLQSRLYSVLPVNSVPCSAAKQVVKRLLATASHLPRPCVVRPDVRLRSRRCFSTYSQKRPEDRYALMQEVVAAFEACPACPTARSPGRRQRARRFAAQS